MRRTSTDDGLLVFHISGRCQDLHPVFAAIGRKLGLSGVWKNRTHSLTHFENATNYFVLARNPSALEPLLQRGWMLADDAAFPADLEPWTDDHTNLLAALVWSSL